MNRFKINIFILTFITGLFFNNFQTTFANNLINTTVNGFKVNIVQYPITSTGYTLKVVKNDDGSKPLRDLLVENNAITGVNGVFFCPTYYSWCNTSKDFTDNERYINGEKYASFESTGDRAVFAWTKDNKPFLFQTDKINIEKESDIFYGLGNYPLLLNEGQNQLEYYYEQGLIFSALKTKQARNFICSDKDGQNIYFGYVYSATIDDLVQVLSDFGCYNALNLDAGGSTAFVYNGKMIAGPGKDIIDGVAIENKNINVKELVEKANKISNSINEKIKDKKNYKNLLLKIEDHLNKLKQDIYTKNSKDIIDKDGKVNGYKVEINDTETLKKVYLLNLLIRNIQLLEIEQENN